MSIAGGEGRKATMRLHFQRKNPTIVLLRGKFMFRRGWEDPRRRHGHNGCQRL